MYYIAFLEVKMYVELEEILNLQLPIIMEVQRNLMVSMNEDTCKTFYHYLQFEQTLKLLTFALPDCNLMLPLFLYE